METMLQFMKQTETWSYIVGILSMAVFLVFWRVLTAKPVERKKREATVRRTQLDDEGLPAGCAGFVGRGDACWEARKAANGWIGMPPECAKCQLYRSGAATRVM